MIVGKQCKKCRVKKRFEEFYKYFDHKQGKHYYQSRCKSCVIEDVTARRQKK